MVAALAPHAFQMFVTCSKLDAAKSIVWHFLEVSAGAGEEEKRGGCAAGQERQGTGGSKNKTKKSFRISLLGFSNVFLL